MIAISLANEQQELPIDPAQVHKTVRHVLESHTIREAAISIAVVDDAAISHLQKQYYGTEQVTDVLSFDLGEESSDAEENPALDCEVVVNAQRAGKMAQQENLDAQAELHLYIVHGLLHQLGYDDRETHEAERMHQKEDQILEELGFAPAYRLGERR
jgi:probable rRNA maturation factor